MNAQFNLHLFPGSTITSGYPTNPFYNPTAGTTTFNGLYHSGNGPSTPPSADTHITNINCLLPGGAVDYVLVPQNICLYQANSGLLRVPVGMMGDSIYVPYTICTPTILGCSTVNPEAFGVKAPSGITDTCAGILISGGCQDSSGFDLTTGIIGTPILLDPTVCPNGACVGDPTCTSFSAGSGTKTSTSDPTNTSPNSCWQQDVSTVLAAQARNPPCIQGVTVCITNTPRTGSSQNVTLTNPVNGTSTYTNPFNGQTKTYIGYTYTPANCPNKSGAMLVNGNCQVTVTVIPTLQKVWYVYRMIASLSLQIVPPTVTPYCVSLTGANTCTNGVPNCPLFTTCTWNPNGVLQSWAPSIVNNLNKVSVLSNTQIAFGLSVPSQATLACSQSDIQSNNCWWGIIGVWIGAQGFQTAGCAATGNTCSFTTGTSAPHAQLPIYSCPQMIPSCSASLPLTNEITGIASLNNQTTAQVISNNVYSQIFTYINTQSFGPQYACQGGPSCPSCTTATLASCLTAPTNMVVNVPLIFDVLGTQQLANWLYQYPGIPPAGGGLTGNVFGKVTDQNGSPIAGACVGINGLCSFASGQYQRSTNNQGLYSFSTANLPAGVYSVYASATGYVSSFQTGISLGVGSNVEVDFSLQLIPQPPNQSCLIPPVQVPNLNPFQPPTYTPGILCFPPIPSYVLPAILILAGLGLVAAIFLTPAGSAVGLGVAGLIPRKRRL